MWIQFLSPLQQWQFWMHPLKAIPQVNRGERGAWFLQGVGYFEVFSMSSDTNWKDDSTNAGGACWQMLHTAFSGVTLQTGPAFVVIREAWELSTLLSICSSFLDKNILVLLFPHCLVVSVTLTAMGGCRALCWKTLVWDASAGTRGQHHPGPLRRFIGGFKRNTTRQLPWLSAFSLNAMTA